MSASSLSAKVGLVALAGAVMAVVGAGASEAAIRCQGNYQLSGGRLLATPYCEDNNIAVVAREYGMRVNADTIRWNINAKRNVCQVVGYDNRVRSACAGLDRSFRKRRPLFLD